MGSAGCGVADEIELSIAVGLIREGHEGLAYPEAVAALRDESGGSVGEAILCFAIRADVAQRRGEYCVDAREEVQGILCA